jgi:hypothetical protein
MLPEVLAQQVRTAGGEALILDAKRSRALLSDAGRIEAVCKELRAIGFSRFIDFTAQHLEGERFSMSLVLRNPAADHAHLVLKWTYKAISTTEPQFSLSALQQEPKTNGQQLPHKGETGGNGSMSEKESSNGAGSAPPPEKMTHYGAHASLSSIWPAAGTAEREIFDMFGIVFSGNENLSTLLLDEQFQGFPLRRDYAVPHRENYAERVLAERHLAALLEQGE